MASLSELELDRVLGMRITAQVAADLIALEARLDRLERSPRRNGWVVGHDDPGVASGQPLSVALDRTLSYPSAADDSLELADLRYNQPEHLTDSRSLLAAWSQTS